MLPNVRIVQYPWQYIRTDRVKRGILQHTDVAYHCLYIFLQLFKKYLLDHLGPRTVASKSIGTTKQLHLFFAVHWQRDLRFEIHKYQMIIRSSAFVSWSLCPDVLNNVERDIFCSNPSICKVIRNFGTFWRLAIFETDRCYLLARCAPLDWLF